MGAHLLHDELHEVFHAVIAEESLGFFEGDWLDWIEACGVGNEADGGVLFAFGKALLADRLAEADADAARSSARKTPCEIEVRPLSTPEAARKKQCFMMR